MPYTFLFTKGSASAENGAVEAAVSAAGREHSPKQYTTLENAVLPDVQDNNIDDNSIDNSIDEMETTQNESLNSSKQSETIGEGLEENLAEKSIQDVPCESVEVDNSQTFVDNLNERVVASPDNDTNANKVIDESEEVDVETYPTELIEDRESLVKAKPIIKVRKLVTEDEEVNKADRESVATSLSEKMTEIFNRVVNNIDSAFKKKVGLNELRLLCNR